MFCYLARPINNTFIVDTGLATVHSDIESLNTQIKTGGYHCDV